MIMLCTLLFIRTSSPCFHPSPFLTCEVALVPASGLSIYPNFAEVNYIHIFRDSRPPRCLWTWDHLLIKFSVVSVVVILSHSVTHGLPFQDGSATPTPPTPTPATSTPTNASSISALQSSPSPANVPNALPFTHSNSNSGGDHTPSLSTPISPTNSNATTPIIPISSSVTPNYGGHHASDVANTPETPLNMSPSPSDLSISSSLQPQSIIGSHTSSWGSSNFTGQYTPVSSDSQTSTTPHTNPSESSHIAQIAAGGVVGFVVFLILVVFIVRFAHQRRKRRGGRLFSTHKYRRACRYVIYNRCFFAFKSK